MIRATTPTVILTLPETVDLTTADEIYVTFRQQRAAIPSPVYTTELTKTDVTLDGTHTIYVYLSQAETLAFTPNKPIEVQVNWLKDGVREATLISTLTISDNLIPEVISS